MKQTSVEWLVNRWKKLQAKGEKMNWNQIIQITELAKEVPSSQTEISDEEIENEAEKITNIGNRREYWKQGIKWYREQLNNNLKLK